MRREAGGRVSGDGGSRLGKWGGREEVGREGKWGGSEAGG